jgi:tetratricopeptide (TPR) repeat protein
VDGAFERIFDLQTQLANALTNALVVRVSASERERISEQRTTSPEALSAYWRGVALMERFDISGNLDRAIASYQQATAIDPKFALAHAALGRAYWEKYAQTKDAEWTAKALEAGATALRVDATLPEVRLAMATILNGTGRHAEAIEELNQALMYRPNYDDARRQLGQSLARLGRTDDAVAEFEKAIALRPTAWVTYSSLGTVLFAAARYDEAIKALTTATELQPDNNIGFQQLGTVYQAVGRDAEAIQSYRRALELRPSPQAYSNLGTLEYAAGAYQAAAEAYAAAIRLRPNSAATHRNLGDALTRLNRPESAQRAYLEAVRLAEIDLKVSPTDPRAMAALAVYAAKAGRRDDAGRHISRAISLATNDVEVLFRAAVVEALGHRTEAALNYLEQAAALGYSAASIAKADEFEALRSHPRFQALVNPQLKEHKR